MKRIATTLLLAVFALQAAAQYTITFIPKAGGNGMYYIGRHFRDRLTVIDSAQCINGQIVFSSKQKINTGIYAFMGSDKKKIFDFMVDDSRKFSITYDANATNANMVIKGSKANEKMYEYLAKLDYGRQGSKECAELRKTDPAKAESKMKALTAEMEAYMTNYQKEAGNYYFGKLCKQFENIKVPEEMPESAKGMDLNNWQAIYFRTHFWDNVDFNDHSLIYTPHLFDKMNYYFFGLLYYQAPDTISRYIDLTLHKIEKDSTMLHYFLDFITPKYERATKNVGWDQVFVNIVQNYYLQGKCPWATEAELYNKRQTIDYLGSSLIGAIGKEILMPDSNQSMNANNWISSHYFPQRYVVIWIWDPDCHHCQEQSEELKIVYDSLTRAGNKRFEVYAIGYESDVDKWKHYIQRHQFPFVNVGGSNVNIDYQEAYNVHSAPTMIILDADRRIIMNKDIPARSIMQFLDNYEKEHPEMATKVTPWMREQPQLKGRQ